MDAPVSGQEHTPHAYLILSLKLERGLRGRGTVSFTFELDCQTDCQFVFMQVNCNDKSYGMQRGSCLNHYVIRVRSIKACRSFKLGADV